MQSGKLLLTLPPVLVPFLPQATSPLEWKAATLSGDRDEREKKKAKLRQTEPANQKRS